MSISLPDKSPMPGGRSRSEKITWMGPGYAGVFAFKLVWSGSLILPMASRDI